MAARPPSTPHMVSISGSYKALPQPGRASPEKSPLSSPVFKRHFLQEFSVYRNIEL